MHFGSRIEVLLAEQGITQRKLAADLNLNPNTINGYIKNRRSPDGVTLSRIARYLGTNVDYLLGNTNIKVYPDLSLTRQEELILNYYRSMRPKEQHMLEELSYALYAHSCSQNSPDSI